MREAAIPAFAGRPEGHGDADAELLGLYRAQDWPAFFSLAVKAKKTIAATGSTGSGKTSLLRRLMQEIPGEERLVTIEDTDEFGPLPLRNRVSMFTGPRTSRPRLRSKPYCGCGPIASRCRNCVVRKPSPTSGCWPPVIPAV